MKTDPASITARATLSGLFFIVSVFLVLGAVNSNVLTNGSSGTLQAQVGPTPIPLAPQDTGPKIGYENFVAPGVLVPVKTTEAGQQPDSVEYMGRNAGEPSVGSNWVTGVDNFQSGLQTLFVTFDDSCPASGTSSTWVQSSCADSYIN